MCSVFNKMAASDTEHFIVKIENTPSNQNTAFKEHFDQELKKCLGENREIFK